MTASLFIGRWQRFHAGHKALIDTVLKEGKKVIIAIRDTELSYENPYTFEQRKEMIEKIYGEEVNIIKIPDIDEVCYGRDVGYTIREIRLDKKIESISGTEIRKGSAKIIWLTGNVGSGKTTLGRILQKKLNSILLDGNEMRYAVSETAGFSKEDREAHNLRVARLAKVLQSQGFHVIIAIIAPFQDTRDKIDKIIKPLWVYLKREQPEDKEKPYEPPKTPDLIIDTDKLSIEESIDSIWRGIYT